jgi:hypothetical protein
LHVPALSTVGSIQTSTSLAARIANSLICSNAGLLLLPYSRRSIPVDDDDKSAKLV